MNKLTKLWTDLCTFDKTPQGAINTIVKPNWIKEKKMPTIGEEVCLTELEVKVLAVFVRAHILKDETIAQVLKDLTKKLVGPCCGCKNKTRVK